MDTPLSTAESVRFELNGSPVEVPDGDTLLDSLRERLGVTSVKDGCSPQGQCGCCTVLVDGQPRVSCVTPVKRVTGRSVTTLEGLPEETTGRWADALCATGGSQCGFCTPGIIVRLAGMETKKPDAGDAEVRRALAAHLCRCTGWNTIVEAWDVARSGVSAEASTRDLGAAARRAEIEGGVPQQVGPAVALGQAAFAADTAPAEALVALRGHNQDWVVGETLAEARAAAGKVQGRRTTLDPTPPLAVPAGDWDVQLQTNWVEPAYLETDASWCEPGGEPASLLANGGAFGAKVSSIAGREARRLADDLGRPVRVVLSREDAVRLGPKRPPIAGGANADGTGEIHVIATPGIASAIGSVAPSFVVVEHETPGPATSAEIRGAGWVEALVLLRAATGESGPLTGPSGAVANAVVDDDVISVRVDAGEILDPVTLRSYVIGAAHMAWSWVTSEAISVDPDGVIHDLTIRSFRVTRALDTPRVEVELINSDQPPVNGSDAVFAAVASAVWEYKAHAPIWPTD